MEQALAVRVLDRLVAGADEDAFESAEDGGNEHSGDIFDPKRPRSIPPVGITRGAIQLNFVLLFHIGGF